MSDAKLADLLDVRAQRLAGMLDSGALALVSSETVVALHALTFDLRMVALAVREDGARRGCWFRRWFRCAS